MLKKFSKISEILSNRNPYWEYKIDEYLLPNGKKELYYYAHTPGSTMVIPIIQNKYLLTKQFRYLNQKNSIEFPGGGIKPEHTIEANARLELIQETGYSTNLLYQIGSFNPCNGLTNEICYVFVAKELVSKAQDLDESEEIEILFLSEVELIEKIKNGEIWDGMTLASWSLYKSLYS